MTNKRAFYVQSLTVEFRIWLNEDEKSNKKKEELSTNCQLALFVVVVFLNHLAKKADTNCLFFPHVTSHISPEILVCS